MQSTRRVMAIGFAALALLPALAPGAAAADKPVQGQPADFALTSAEQQRVEAGGITVQHQTTPRGYNEFFSAGYVDAPLEEVFRFYENYRNTSKFQDSIKDIKLIEDLGRYRQLEYWMNLPFPIGNRHFVLDLAGDGTPGQRAAIWWSLDHGDINAMTGSYVMDAAGPDRTLVKYHIVADMNTWVPSWLVGFIQGGTIHNVVAAARREFRAPNASR